MVAIATYRDKFEITLPAVYLTAIGGVCVQWAQLETQVDLAIRKLCNFDLFDSRATVLTAHMTWPLKMGILEALITELRDKYPQLARFDDVKPLLTKPAEGRNRVVHALWAYENGQASILRATARGKLKTTIVPVAVAEIEGIADDVGRAAAQLLKAILNK